MTITDIDTAPPISAAPTWTRVEPTLWVASTRWEFLGTVEQDGDRYLAFDQHAIEIGAYPDLDAAKRQVQHPESRGYERRRRDAGQQDVLRSAWVAVVLAGAVAVSTVSLLTAGML